MKWLFWPVSVAGVARTGRYFPYEAAGLARIGGRYGPCWPSRAVRSGCSGPYRWPAWPGLAVIPRTKWLFWPASLAAMSRIGRYLLCEVAVLARIAGRYEPYWPLFAVWRGCSGPYRWPL